MTKDSIIANPLTIIPKMDINGFLPNLFPTMEMINPGIESTIALMSIPMPSELFPDVHLMNPIN